MAHDIAVEKFPVVYGYATRHPGMLILDDLFRLPVVLEELLEEFVDLLVVIKSVKPAWFFSIHEWIQGWFSTGRSRVLDVCQIARSVFMIPAASPRRVP